jgi:matrixin/carboxypeptidase family protein
MTARRLLAAAAIVIVTSAVAQAYLKIGFSVGNRVVSIKWTTLPIRYFVTNRDVDGVTAPQLQGVVDRAFGTWQSVPGITLSSQFIGLTSSNPVRGDGSTVIGFQSRPDLDRVLGATNWVIDSTNGAVLESDIFLNSTFTWSTAANGDPSRFDVESVALHELGHLLGLGHSALGETQLRTPGPGRDVLGKRAVMFPIAYPRGVVLDRTLEADDIVGITDIYATTDTERRLGSIAGKVTLNGAGIFGAHVTAFNSATQALVGGFTLNTQGEFVISSLEPGMYVVRVEPLDDADLDSFFDDDQNVNINFKPAYYAKLVAVPANGTSGSIEVKVQAK